MTKKCYYIFISTQGKICDEEPLSTKVYVRKFHYRVDLSVKGPFLFYICYLTYVWIFIYVVMLSIKI